MHFGAFAVNNTMTIDNMNASPVIPIIWGSAGVRSGKSEVDVEDLVIVEDLVVLVVFEVRLFIYR